MRKQPIEALFPGVRRAILSATLLQADKWWYLSDLAKHLAMTPSSLQREVRSLSVAGILENRREGNRLYYRANPQCPFIEELKGLLAKNTGIPDVLGGLSDRF